MRAQMHLDFHVVRTETEVEGNPPVVIFKVRANADRSHLGHFLEIAPGGPYYIMIPTTLTEGVEGTMTVEGKVDTMEEAVTKILSTRYPHVSVRVPQIEYL